MDLSEIHKRVMAVVCDQLGIGMDEVMLDTTLRTDLYCSDYDLLEITWALEDEFAIEFDREDEEVIHSNISIGELADLVSKYLG